MGPRAGLDGGKSRPTGIQSPDPPARSSVAIPTELPGPRIVLYEGHLESKERFAIKKIFIDNRKEK